MSGYYKVCRKRHSALMLGVIAVAPSVLLILLLLCIASVRLVQLLLVASLIIDRGLRGACYGRYRIRSANIGIWADGG